MIDHLGNRIDLSVTPKRIVSLVPSQTELLYDLGLEEINEAHKKLNGELREELAHVRKALTRIP